MCTDTIEPDENGLASLGFGVHPERPGAWAFIYAHHMCFMASVLPITVHYLREGLPLCGFSREVPRAWPHWNLWTDRELRVTCERCRARLVKH